MSDSEDESFCFYGKPLEQYDEDSIPKRKPTPVEEQIATDSHGRRRFHGAFTGGFSAGFFNTVGSLEGWKPTEFKSSRSEKAETKLSKPEDFMDDEDLGEHGIAPQVVRATKDYTTGNKRKKPVFSDGPIPGVPVLHSLIEAGNETIGYLLMKNMDLKSKDKESEDLDDGPKVYGCEMPKTYEIQRNIEKEDIIPKIFQDYIKNPKNNTFGLGYVGLDKSELSLRKSTQLVVTDQNNRKLAISGQAFGVGAFENDDDDIYAKDDMSQYDFEISKEKSKKIERQNFNHPEFVKGVERLLNNSQYPPPTIPHSFTGKHKVRKSRFEPIPTDKDVKKEEIKRKDMNAAVRAKYLGEEVPGPSTSREVTRPSPTEKEEFKKPAPVTKIKQEKSLIFDKFVSASTEENPHDILQKVEPTYTEHGTKEMRDAAKLKMFGPLTHIVADWRPCSLLCKRFNVREPTYEGNKKDKTKKNQIFFEYEKHKEEGINFKAGLSNSKEEDIKKQTEEIIPPETIVKTIDEKTIDTSMDKPKEIKKTIEETDKIDVAKNIDLFKAVFLTDSDSEDESENPKEVEEDTNREMTIKNNLLNENLITKIKPRKEGILSNIKFDPLMPQPAVMIRKNQLDFGFKTNLLEPAKIGESKFMYGPQLPATISKLTVSNLEYEVPQMDIDEEWVEREKIRVEKEIRDRKKRFRERHRRVKVRRYKRCLN